MTALPEVVFCIALAIDLIITLCVCAVLEKSAKKAQDEGRIFNKHRIRVGAVDYFIAAGYGGSPLINWGKLNNLSPIVKSD